MIVFAERILTYLRNEFKLEKWGPATRKPDLLTGSSLRCGIVRGQFSLRPIFHLDKAQKSLNSLLWTGRAPQRESLTCSLGPRKYGYKKNCFRRLASEAVLFIYNYCELCIVHCAF